MQPTLISSTAHIWGMLGLMAYLLLLSGCASGAATLSPPTPFTPVPVDFTHTWTKSSHPFTGAAVIDIDGDGIFEIFIGGGAGQRDALLSYRSGRLVNIEPGTGLSRDSTTYGSTAIDLDADGDTDLLVAREDGVYLISMTGDGFRNGAFPWISRLTWCRLASPLRISTTTATETCTSVSS
jgi:enediyne biosynthesis protein E4